MHCAQPYARVPGSIHRVIPLDEAGRKRRAIVTYPAHGTSPRKHRSNFLKISADNIYPFRLGESRVNEAGNKRRQITTRERERERE